jgi:hypothetical protein
MRRIVLTSNGYLMSLPENDRAKLVRQVFENAETLSTENRGWDVNIPGQHWSA